VEQGVDDVHSTGLGVEAIRALNRPLEEARPLPATVYTEEAFARLENERLFPKLWLPVGGLHEVPHPGDGFPMSLAGRPVLVLRDDKGAVRAFYNACRHRGTRLIGKPCRRRSNIRCPYHAWTYGLDGRLLSAPHFDGFGQMSLSGRNKEEFGLVEIRCETWHQWIFVNLDGKAPPLSSYLGSFAEHYRDYDFSLLRHGKRLSFEVEANWKLLVENYVEALHIPTVHPKYNDYGPFQDYATVADGHCLGTVIEVGYPDDWKSPLSTFPGLPERWRLGTRNLLLFPYFTMVAAPDHVLTSLLIVRSPDSLVWQKDFYFIGEAASDAQFDAAREAVISYNREIIEQDVSLLTACQAGLAAKEVGPGLFSPAFEQATWHFQQLVANYIG
jgi:choline monooxygenase